MTLRVMLTYNRKIYFHAAKPKDVFNGGTRNVPQITFLNFEKLNRKNFIRFSSIPLDLKYKLCSLIHSKTSLKFGCNSPFYTNIDNGLWDIATVTMQWWNPERCTQFCVFFNFAPRCLVLRQVLSS